MTQLSENLSRASFARLQDPARTCPNCGGKGMSIFYAIDGIPVHTCLMMPTRQEALDFPTGDLRLGFCSACGFIANTSFCGERHSYGARYEESHFSGERHSHGARYEESQGASPRFNEFLENLAGRLIARYDVRRKTVLEIGCGKGEFLVRMCELGDNSGVGVDPSCAPERLTSAARITWVRDFYGPKHSDIHADFVCCRHTLEHIAPTRQFLRQIRQTLGARAETIVFFEVPDALRILREGAFWDLYYEHCSYFSAGSLARLFRGCGFDLLELEVDYGGQYILLVARPAVGENLPQLDLERDLPLLAAAVDGFPSSAQAQVHKWGHTIRQAASAGEQVVLWGAGSKCAAFMATLKLSKEVRCVVDVSPPKQGTFLPGAGHEIVAPGALAQVRPDLVIAMNPIYTREIQRELDRLNLRARLTAV